jgi:hypothetical protein
MEQWRSPKRGLSIRAAQVRTLVAAAVLALTAGACSELLRDGYDYGAVHVETVRRNGDPIPGVELALYSGARVWARGVSDADGRYVFRFVPPGNFGVRAVPPRERYAVVEGRGRSFIDGLQIDLGRDTAVSFTFLKFGDGAVQVAVRDPAGNPVPGTRLILYSGTVRMEATADVNGVHRFEPVPFGNFGVRAVPPAGYSARERRGEAFMDGIEVDEGSVERAVLQLLRNGRIRVQIVDAAGAGVPATEVLLYSGAGHVDRRRTDPRGEVEFGPLPADAYGIRLTQIPAGFAMREARGSSFVDGIRIEPERFDTVRVTLLRKGIVRARVQDPAGTPLAGAKIWLYTAAGIQAEGVTGPSGTIVFADLDIGQYGLQLQPPVGYRMEPGRGGSFIDGIAVEPGVDLLNTFTVFR